MNHPLPIAVLLCVFTFGLHAQSPAQDPGASRLETLKPKVAALKDDGATGQVKAVLNVALERVKACHDAGDAKDADDLINDIEAALAKNPESLVVPSSNTNTISAIRPPKEVAGNPYIERMVEAARLELSKPDKPFAKNTPSVNTFSGLSVEGGSRSAGDEMQAWLWLYANPASPMKGDPKVLERYLRLATAYADAIDIHGGLSLAGSSASTGAEKGTPLVGGQGSKGNENAPLAGQGIFDDFAIAPVSTALREFAQLQPGLLLPSQKALWDRAMKTGGAVMWLKARDRQGTYANIDLSLALQLLNFGLYLDNEQYLDKSRFLYEAQEKSIYPDGGIAYLGHQNESANYHNSDTRDLARIYEINQDPKILEFLKKTEWFGPVTSGKLGEFWTVPSWKDTWNDATPWWTGGEPVASLTGNPYLRGMNDLLLSRQKDPKGWTANRNQLAWWRGDVKPLPLPDNFTVIDRNIAGPRAWYGRFSYAASMRSVPENEPGLLTLMGAQLTDTNGQIGQVLMGAGVRVRYGKEEITKDGKFIRQAFASRTCGLKSAIVMGRTFSAVAGTYQLQQYQSAQPGKPVDWTGRQLWLGLPDRIIGLVEIAPTKDGTTAMGVEGVLRLGTGGTINGKSVKITQTGMNSWSYGDLRVTFHGHNGAKIETPEVPFRLPKFPNTEIRVLDSNGATSPTIASPYPASFRQWFLVEVSTPEAKETAVVRRLDQPTGLMGMEVNVGKKRFLMVDNPGDRDLGMIPVGAVNGATLHGTNGVVGTIPSNLTLKPGELEIIVSSPDPQDHLKGWSSYQEMVAQPPVGR